jgi:hypothetical protein
MRFRFAGGLDLATGALVLGGALLVAASIVAAVVTLSPSQAVRTPDASELAAPAPMPGGERPANALPSDRVATVLAMDPSAGAGGTARPGDHVDVLGYFSRAVNSGAGNENVTRVLAQDVPVLAVDRSGSQISLTLAVTQNGALLMHEALALGAKPMIALRPVDAPAGSLAPTAFSDSDLAHRLAVAP